MEIMFTPWRYEYVSTVDDRKGCVFCDTAADDSDRDNLIVYRAEKCFAILNMYPYSTGHLMIVPYEHARTIEDLDVDTLSEMMTVAQKCMKAIRNAFENEGFNIGINITRVAGAGITEHVHMHVVPRWSGDANFMSVTGNTRVLPLSLDEVWKKLAEELPV
ncbi:MAG: HIT family hydrolase [Candidatus Anoxymicrobium japonicum]|uniref:HIT family hydrolase n=1 Tax=Candidatus Anoxymicrobium japonicum TaxID=2013648 RepID=A0A2N3G4Y7_9ACTN|nr:MAG: HIT family hydrolase [Candidatus Anoxymicrobium japonicum]